MNFTGRQIVLDFHNCGCSAILFSNPKTTEDILKKAAHKGGTKVKGKAEYSNFADHSRVLLCLDEGHILIHTFPESQSCMIDFLTTGTIANANRAVNYLMDSFKPFEYYIKSFIRGEKCLNYQKKSTN